MDAISQGIRAALQGLLVNAFLTGVKLVAGIVGNSYALIADAVESGLDIFSSLIVWRGLRVTARPADQTHLDKMPDQAVVDRIATAARSVSGVMAIEKLRVRTFGTGYFVDVHVQADPQMPLREAHILSGRVKSSIREAVPAVFDTSIHMEPFESGSR